MQQMNLKNNILFKKIIRNSYPSCVLYAFVMNMTFSVDSLIAGILLSSDAVVAVGIGTPFIGLMIAAVILVVNGTFLKSIQCMGRSDDELLKKVFTSGLVIAALLSIIFVSTSVFGGSALAAAGGAARANEAILNQTTLYIISAAGMIPFFSLGMLFQGILASYGYQSIRMSCSVLNIIVNIVGSVAAVKLLPEQYAVLGLGAGSTIGALSQFILSLVMMIKKCPNAKVSFFVPHKADLIMILDILRSGIPSSADSIIDSVAASFVNNLILSIFANGTLLVEMLVIVKTVKSVVLSFSNGARHVSEPLFSILYQERDLNGLKAALRNVLKSSIFLGASVGIIVILAHGLIMGIYHMSGNTELRIAIIMIGTAAPLFAAVTVMNAFYETTGRLWMSAVVSIVPDSILYPLLITALSSLMGSYAIWTALSYNSIVFAVLFYLVLAIVYRTPFITADQILMINEKLLKHVPSFDNSIANDQSEISLLSKNVQNFFVKEGYSKKNALYAALCIEEIATDYASYRTKRKKNDESADFSMDIKVFSDEDHIEIIIRNFDDRYNALMSDGADDVAKIGIKMVQKLARSIIYNYVYHLNVITIVLDKEKISHGGGLEESVCRQ